MKKQVLVALVLLSLLTGYGLAVTASRVLADDEAGPAQVVRHVVMFKFKDDAKPEDIRKVEAAFCALSGKIDVIRGMEWGTDVSPEGLSQGFTHCFFLTFDNAADRDAYLVHPDHKAFGEGLGPVLDKVAVVDYYTKP